MAELYVCDCISIKFLRTQTARPIKILKWYKEWCHHRLHITLVLVICTFHGSPSPKASYLNPCLQQCNTRNTVGRVQLLLSFFLAALYHLTFPSPFFLIPKCQRYNFLANTMGKGVFLVAIQKHHFFTLSIFQLTCAFS